MHCGSCFFIDYYDYYKPIKHLITAYLSKRKLYEYIIPFILLNDYNYHSLEILTHYINKKLWWHHRSASPFNWPLQNEKPEVCSQEVRCHLFSTWPPSRGLKSRWGCLSHWKKRERNEGWNWEISVGGVEEKTVKSGGKELYRVK